MTDKPTERDVNAAQMDAQAFGMTAAFNRVAFIKGLLDDPATRVFSKDVVRWLVQALEHERIGRSNDQTKGAALQDRIEALEARQPMPKSKAIVKLAKVVARQADAITEVNQAIIHAGADALNESQAMDDLSDALSAWQKTHKDTIEAAEYGD